LLDLNPNFNDAVKAEFDSMKKNSGSLDKAAKDGLDAITKNKQQYTDMIKNFDKEVDTLYKTYDDQEGNINKIPDYTKIARILTYIFTFAILFFMIVFIPLMACSLRGKCYKCSTFLQALLATVKMLLAILMNAVAIASLVIAAISNNGCYAGEKAMNDQAYQKAIPGGFRKVFDSCVYRNSTGSVSELIPDKTQFDTITNMTETFSAPFDKYNEDLAVPGSKALNKYYTLYYKPQIEDYASPNLFAKTSGQNPQTFINAQNDATTPDAIQCNQDKFALHPSKCPSGFTAINSTETPLGVKKNQNGGNCIIVSTWDLAFNAGATATSRYSQGDGDCASARQLALENIRLCTFDINSKIGDFKTAIRSSNSGPNGAATEYYNSINNIKTHYDSLSNSVKSSADMIKSATAGLDTFFNCKIMRVETRNTIGNFCINFTRPFTTQAILIAIISVLFWILAFCVCCSFKQSKDMHDLAKL
jgi:hypothetical protein